MQPNIEFRIGLPKINPSLAKSHLQRKIRDYAQKTTPEKSIAKNPQKVYTLVSTNYQKNLTLTFTSLEGASH